MINTGLPPVPDDLSSINDPNKKNPDTYLGTAAIVSGGEPGSTTKFENAKIQAIAPNGANAYLSSRELPLDTSAADFSYFELPRTTNQLSAHIQGEHKQLNLSEREKLQLLDRLQGIKGSNLSSTQVAQTADHQLVHNTDITLENNSLSENVNVTICDEDEQCEVYSLGENGSSKVTVGDVSHE